MTAATSAALTVEKKIHSVSDLVQKIDYDIKILDAGFEVLTTSDYNKFSVEILDKKIKEKGLVDKSIISELIDNSD